MNISSILHKKKLLSETIDIEALQFPPMAKGAFGQYFVGPSGEIPYSVIGQKGNGNHSGVAHVNNFLKTYKKDFAPYITPEMVEEFKTEYSNKFADKNDKIEDTALKFPEIFNSQSAKWVADDDEVTYRIKTAQGEQQGFCPIEEFTEYYENNKEYFGSNQVAAMHPNESNKEAMARRMGLSEIK